MSITVSIILDKTRITKKGYPVKLRITSNRVSEYISLKMYFSIDSFERITTLKRLGENDRFFKSEFQKVELKAENIIRSMSEYSFQSFKELYSGGNESKKVDTRLSVLIDLRVKDLKSSNKFKSADVYHSLKTSLERFKHGAHINKVTPEFLQSYHNYLIGDKKSITTVSIYMKSLRAILNGNKTLVKKYPFEEYKIPKGRNNKRAINGKDLKKILNYSFGNQTDDFYLSLYKFSYLSGGMNLRDVAVLKHSDIIDGILTFNRSKTGVMITIHLLKEALDIVNTYTDINSAYLFPLIDNDEPRYIYGMVHKITKHVNRRLKKVCTALNIPIVTCMSSRHSFATSLLRGGVSIAFISQSLGHTSIQTTQNYLGSFSPEQSRSFMQALI